MTILKENSTGREIQLEEDYIHKYWSQQKPWHGTAFIMQEYFDNDYYEAFAVLVQQEKGAPPTWIMFWRDTVKQQGEPKLIPGLFNSKAFIRIPISAKDAEQT